MADSRTVVVKLKADTNSYRTSMKGAAESTDQLDKAQAKAQARSQRWKTIGMASQVAGAAVAAGLLMATKAASDQEQAIGSLTAVFKTNGAQMEANARAATQIGMSTTEYSMAAAKLGSQLANLGVDQADLGMTTDDLIRKAGDLAAQFGGTTQEAVDALGAAFRGEADPAERYGLALNVTKVNAEMAATGADKATAMMSLLNKQMEKSGTVGAWNREIETTASQTMIAQKEFDNATASLGEALLPAMASAAKFASKLLEKFNGLSDGTKGVVTKLTVLGAVALLVGPKIATMTTAAINLKNAMTAAGGATGGAAGKTRGFAASAGKIAAVGAAAAVAVPVVSAFMDAMTERRFGATTNDLDLLGQQIVRFSETGSGEIGRFGGEIRELGDAFVQMGSYWEQAYVDPERYETTRDEVNALDQTLSEMVKNGYATEAAAAVEGFKTQTVAAGGSVEDVTGALPQYQSAQEASAVATENSTDASWKDTEAKDNQAEALKKTVAQYEAYFQAVQRALGLLSARDALIGQEERLADAVKANGTALRGQTKAAAANRAAIAGEVSSVSDLVQQTYENVAAKKGEAEGLKAANRVRKEQIATLLDNAEAAGLDRDQTKALLKQLNLLKPINTSIKVEGLTAAERQAKSLLDSLIAASGLGAFGIGGQRRATGGYITGPGTGTSDDIPAMLSNGEYVMTAKATRRLGVRRLDAMNYASGGVVGYGSGGGVGTADLAVGAGRALRQVQKWRDAVRAARENVRDLRQQVKDYAESVASNALSAGGPDLFDSFTRSGIIDSWRDLAAAQDKVSESSRRVYEAQVAVNTSSPENRAAALATLADAQRDLATAQTDQTAAQTAANKATPTAAGMLGRMRERARLIGAYATKVKSLMAKGLSMSLIKELAGADPIEAGPVLDALLKMTPAQLKELGSLDTQARNAAASVGTKVAAKVNKKATRSANIELRATTKQLDKDIRTADQLLDRKWRRMLAKAGLGAEERVQLMQSIRDNDGKLTTHWRNVLANAGLGAEERGDILAAINGADTVLTAHWRNKLAAAGLSAEDRGDLQQSLIANDGKLTREWRDKLAAAGLSAAERNNLITNGIRDADTKARVDWTNNDYHAGLGAERRGLAETVADERNKGAAGWRDDKYRAGLDAERRGLAESVQGERRDKAAGWGDFKAKAGLDAERRGLAETVAAEKKKGGAGWQGTRFNAWLGANADLPSVRRASYAVALESWRLLKKSGLGTFTRTPRPNPRDFGLATGGLVLGAGTGTSDSIPVRLSNGEYVIRAASVKRYGADLMDAINMGRFASGGPVGFRTTTPVSGSSGGMQVVASGVPVVVKLDNRTVATGQLKLRRQSGGTVTLGG